MKRLFLLTLFILYYSIIHCQNVGIGTTAPRVKLHVVKGNPSGNPYTGSTMAIQSETQAFLNLLSNTSQSGIMFGNSTKPLIASIVFNSDGGKDLSFNNGDVLALSINNQGNVGIRTIDPKAALHVADSNVLFKGPATVPNFTSYPPPASGSGTRFMWYPQKAAFRAGNVDGTQWDKDNIGSYSLASGFNTKASGYYSIAMGNSATASATSSTALGERTTASGDNSTATGVLTNASGGASTATGILTTASGDYTTAMGYSTIASGDASTSAGIFTTAKSFSETTVGAFNTDYTPLSSTDWNAADRLFVIGNGTTPVTKSDAVVVLKNGNIGIGTSLPHAQLQLATSLANRKIVLYEVADNDNQFQGFGMNFGVLRYQVNQTGDDHVFYAGTSATTSNELMRIKGNGNVGINNNTPTAKLHVSGSLLVDGTQPTHTAQGTYVEWNRDGGSGKTFILNQKGLGPGGIVFGDINTTNFMIEHLRLDYNGNATLAGSLSQNSDARLKKNIKPLTSSLQNLQQLNGYTYNWIDKARDNDLQVGVLAQEVQKVYPELVKTAADSTLSVNYSGLVPVLIEGMKEQQKQIDELKQLVKILINK